MSKKFSPAEAKYPAHERELLAIVQALQHWRPYLWGHPVTAYTGSTFLKYLKTRQLTTDRQARWVALIETYNITISHIPGTTNTAADALSRIGQPPPTEKAKDSESAIGPLHLASQ